MYLLFSLQYQHGIQTEAGRHDFKFEIGMIQYNGELGTKEVFFDFSDVNDRNILVEGIQVGFKSDSKLEKASKLWEIAENGAKYSNYNMDGEIADDASDCRQSMTDIAKTKKTQR